MNKKVLTYSLVALLTGSTITTFSIIDSAKANDRNQVKAPNPTNISPMHGGTMMAGMVGNNARHPEIRNLPQSIAKSQSTEIAQMQQLLQAMNTQDRNTPNRSSR